LTLVLQTAHFRLLEKERKKKSPNVSPLTTQNIEQGYTILAKAPPLFNRPGKTRSKTRRKRVINLLQRTRQKRHKIHQQYSSGDQSEFNRIV
jgi:hypothetical protein